MRRNFVSHFGRTATAILFGLVAVLSCGKEKSRPTDDKGPWIFCAAPVHEFGRLYSEEGRTHVFRLENRGQSTLEITDIQKQCGCTQPTIDKRSIAPGEFANVTVGFNPPSEGAIEKHVFVYSNDPYQTSLILTIRAIGLGPAHLEPSVLVFSGEVPPEGIVRDLEMTLPEGENFVDVKFDVAAPWMQVEIDRPISGRSAKVHFRLKDLPAPMTLRESIQFTVTSERNGFRKDFALLSPLQVTGEVRPQYAAMPSTLQLGVAKAGTIVEREIRIVSPSDAPEPAASVSGVDGLTVTPGAAPGVFKAVWNAASGSSRKIGAVRFDFGGGRVVSMPVTGAVL